MFAKLLKQMIDIYVYTVAAIWSRWTFKYIYWLVDCPQHVSEDLHKHTIVPKMKFVLSLVLATCVATAVQCTYAPAPPAYSPPSYAPPAPYKPPSPPAYSAPPAYGVPAPYGGSSESNEHKHVKHILFSYKHRV